MSACQAEKAEEPQLLRLHFHLKGRRDEARGREDGGREEKGFESSFL